MFALCFIFCWSVNETRAQKHAHQCCPGFTALGGLRTDTFGTGGSDLPCVCATCVFVLTHWSGTLWIIVKHVSIITAYQKPVNNNVSGVNDLSINVESVYHCPS